MIKKIEAARRGQLVLSLLVLFVFVSCKESGSIGSSFVPTSEVITDTLNLGAINVVDGDPYLGRITFSPVGEFDDPLFGTTSSIAFFKPGINKVDTATIAETDRLVLRLSVNTVTIIGDQETNPAFNIYEVNDFWRGSTYKKSDSVGVNGWPITAPNTLVGSFNYLQVDTAGIVDVELTGDWKDDFRTIYNSEDANRDSTYRFENFGLALTPDPNMNEIIHFNFGASDLLIIDAAQDTTTNPIIDWAYDVTTSVGSNTNETIQLSSILEPYLTLDMETLAQQLDNNNIVRAELIMVADTTQLDATLAPNQSRLSPIPLNMQIGPLNDIPYQLGFNSTNLLSTYSGGVYNFDITGIFNASIFGDVDISETYIYANQNNGIYSNTVVYGLNADDNLQPKIIVYYLESE